MSKTDEIPLRNIKVKGHNLIYIFKKSLSVNRI